MNENVKPATNFVNVPGYTAIPQPPTAVYHVGPPVSEFEQSDNIADLVTALAKAQGQMEKAKKESTNPHFKSRYADLESVWDACRKHLSSNGLSVVQFPYSTGSETGLVTQISHSSGQWMRGKLRVSVKALDAQSVGSAITYMRRYALAAVAGIAQTDDDGEAAVGRGDHKQPGSAIPEYQLRQQEDNATVGSDGTVYPEPSFTAPNKPRIRIPGKKITEPQRKRLMAIMRKSPHGWNEDKLHTFLLNKFGIDHSADILMDNYENICNFVEQAAPPWA